MQMLILFTLASLTLAAPQGLLQPAQYSSPSGEWVISIDPSSRRGAGPSRVEVQRGGKSVWTRRLPLTFWSAAITDEGRVGGYAFTDGPNSFYGELRVQVRSPRGALLGEHAQEMKGSASPCGPKNPRVLSAYAQPELDRYIVRVFDEIDLPGGEEWRSYRLSSGEVLDAVSPKRLLDPQLGLTYAMAARAVRGTPLSIVQWFLPTRDEAGKLEIGTCFVLCDENFRPLWTLPLPRDLEHPDSKTKHLQRVELDKGGGILKSTAPGRFELRHVAAGLRVSYEATRNATAGGWQVREVARAAFASAERQELPQLELPRLGSVPLRANGGIGFDSSDSVHFDGQGRIAIQDERTRAVHVFGTDGERLFVCTPDSDDFESWDEAEDIVAAPDGRVFVQPLIDEDRWLEFGADGARQGWTSLGGSRAAFAPFGAACWSAYEDRSEVSVLCIDAAGVEWARIPRRPDDGSFVYIPALGCAPDAALCVLETSAPSLSRVPMRPRLNFYSSSGETERVIELALEADAWWQQLSYRRHWVLLSDRSSPALLVSIPSGHACFVEGPENDNGSSAFDLSPDGMELWCATGDPLVLHRFELPAVR